MTPITIPDFALIVLIGASGSGKSTFAARHFGPFETISSDYCRGLVSDDPNDQSVTKEAFELVHIIAGRRLAHRRLTVIDATNVQERSRRPLIELARAHHALPVAIVLDVPEKVAVDRNAQRADRNFGRAVVARHRTDLRQSLKRLQREGFRRVYHLQGVDEIDAAQIVREPLWTDLSREHGPFDIIGDVHGCHDELLLLLEKLGYHITPDGVTPPDGRTAVFVGDLVDRGPNSPGVLRLVMGMVAAGTAICVPGNHDDKLKRALDGRNVKVGHGLSLTLAQLADETPQFRKQVRDFLDGLISHYVLDDGNLVVAHAGMTEQLAGRASKQVREFALYGATTGQTDENGFPVRLEWAADYRGSALVVYGHTAVPEPRWLNNTVDIDTGCVFGGSLTALRYPEREIVSIAALQAYDDSSRFGSADGGQPGTADITLSPQQDYDDILDITDVLGKRIIDTRLRPKITIREENAAAALEVMSRFAVNPKWLVYLPPTMSPPETSQRDGYLEYPTEAFDYYRSQGIGQVVCEQKHMGSRAIVAVCRDEAAARASFGVVDEGIGMVYTRTGRRFFTDDVLEAQFLAQVRDAASAAGFWSRFDTPWLLLDCELMPWSAKAQSLLEEQYAAVGAAAGASVADAVVSLQMASSRGADVAVLLDEYRARQTHVAQYVDAYHQYIWPVESLADYRLAPFQLLASEGAVHIDQTHLWQMTTLAELASHEPLMLATEHRAVDLNDSASVADATVWWEALTGQGGEGMVVKPMQPLVRARRGLVQPAVKVRGREYLRIIYGPQYTEQLDVLRRRNLSRKRSLAERELALGIEAIERFVRHEPLRRVHECVFGVLALESEPVDPRL